jgi:hypothetical protein
MEDQLVKNSTIKKKQNKIIKNEGNWVRSRADVVNECIMEDNSKEITKAKEKYRQKTNAGTKGNIATEEEKGEN